MQAQLAQLQTQLERQNKIINDEIAKRATLTEELAKLKTVNSKLPARLSATTLGLANTTVEDYTVYGVMRLVLGVGGFFAGFLWHRKQAMKRLGGQRV